VLEKAWKGRDRDKKGEWQGDRRQDTSFSGGVDTVQYG